jgi:hypothetical protein
VTDFSFVQEDDLWKGSEVHRLVMLANLGTIHRPSVPTELLGYLNARDAFVRETGFIPISVERDVSSNELGIRGRIDCAGLMHGKPALVEWKSGAIQPAVALQLCLGGHLLDEGKWFQRYAVQLKPDGSYTVRSFPLMMWHVDLMTAKCCAQVARWKIKNKVI